MAQESTFNGKQDVFLYNKNKITITGICGVESFDETQITAITQNGEIIAVEGSGIEITDFNIESQILEAKGSFTSIFYDERKIKTKQGILGKLFGEK